MFDEIRYPVYELESSSIYELIDLIKEKKIARLIIERDDLCGDDEKLIRLVPGGKIFWCDDERKNLRVEMLV